MTSPLSRIENPSGGSIHSRSHSAVAGARNTKAPVSQAGQAMPRQPKISFSVSSTRSLLQSIYVTQQSPKYSELLIMLAKMIPSVEVSVSCTCANRPGRLLHVGALLSVAWPPLIATAAAHTAPTRHHASTTTDHADDKQHDAHNRENILQIHIRLQALKLRRGARRLLSARMFRSRPSHCKHLTVYEASLSLPTKRNRPG
jgi:hypothetical protein